MATNPQAEGMTKINFQLSAEEKEQVQRLADDAGVSMSLYIRRLLADHINSGKRYSLIATRGTLDAKPPLSAAKAALQARQKTRPANTE